MGVCVDVWGQRPATLAALVAELETGADIVLCEGVMGLFDGTGPDGSLPNEPVTSTGEMIGPTGNTIDSFPNDLVIVPLP